MLFNEKVIKWMAGPGVGLSAKAMLMCHLDMMSTGDYPHDPSDFLRCLKLLEAVPEVRDSFSKIAYLSPIWKDLIDNWDRITVVLNEEITIDDDGRAPETFRMIREITDKVR